MRLAQEEEANQRKGRPAGDQLAAAAPPAARRTRSSSGAMRSGSERQREKRRAEREYAARLVPAAQRFLAACIDTGELGRVPFHFLAGLDALDDVEAFDELTRRLDSARPKAAAVATPAQDGEPETYRVVYRPPERVEIKINPPRD